MPTIVATKNFMMALFQQSLSEPYSDVLSFLRKDIFGVDLFCDFSSVSELKTAMEQNPIWEILLDTNNNIKFVKDIQELILHDDFYSNCSEQNLFFVDLSASKCEQLQEERGFVYISPNNISQAWIPIMNIRNRGTLKVTTSTNVPNDHKFDTWNKLDEFKLPLTSIIIFDKYILGDKTNQRLKDNLFILLEKHCKNKLKKPLTLTIISEFDTDVDLVNAYNKIEAFLQSKSISNVRINIIKHEKAIYPSNFEGLHYRLFLTNLIRIKSDDSFNFFKSSGKVNNDVDIHLTFNISNPYRYFFEKELSDIKLYTSRVTNLTDPIFAGKSLRYYKDKINNLLQ